MEYADVFYYDETSVTCLRWKVDRLAGNGGRIVVARRGDIAGSLDARGEAYTTRFNGKACKVHKIVVALHGIEVPDGMLIDHEDGNGSNNKISNLRIVPSVLNAHNRRKQHNNSSGVAGVTEWKDQRGSYFWLARWQDGAGKRSCKSFSISKYGLLEAFSLAVKYRNTMIESLNSKGHGYTERHGK